MSNIFVGSSNNNRSGLKRAEKVSHDHGTLLSYFQNIQIYLENKALASDNRIRHPPENVFVGLFCCSGEKPKPFNMIEARAGALSASMFCNCVYTALNLLLSSGSEELQ